MSGRDLTVKKLSSGLLDMKFMTRTKKKLEEREKKKKDVALKEAISEGTTDLPQTSGSRFETTDNYTQLENLIFGRLSFNGFNKEVEDLMVYHEKVRTGQLTDSEDEELEKDISDRDMANTLGNSINKKFATKKQRDAEHQKTDESSGRRFNFSDVRKRKGDVSMDDEVKPKFLKPNF